MALFEVYYDEKIDGNLCERVFESARLVGSAVLNEPPEFTTKPSNVEIVPIMAWKLKEKSGIDFIIAITAVEGRSDPEKRAETLIKTMNKVFPELKFSTFYRYVSETGMMATSREDFNDKPLTLDEALKEIE
jgi:hypothetical protein